MLSRGMSTRAVTIAIIVALHVLLFVMFDRSMRSTSRSIDTSTAYLIFISSAPKPSPSMIAPDTTYRSTKPKIDIPNVIIDIERLPTHLEMPLLPIDWDAEARAAAKRVAKNQLAMAAKRSLDSKPKVADELQADQAPGIFYRGPSHVPGTVVNLGGGVFQTWTSPHCYISSEVDVATGKRVDYKKCPQPPVDGSNLFDHLKPEYLKKPVEEICSKTMAGCNQSK